LAHPLTKGLDIDHPATTELRREIIRSKPFLRNLYLEWYQALTDPIHPLDGPVLELGAGAGFLSEVLPAVIRTDILPTRHIDLACDALHLPFPNRSFASILMINVLHHLSDPGAFFSEASRCVKPGGVIAMIEPWNTAWSQFVYRKFHHERFDAHASQWSLEPGRPLSGANGALPWILFSRDRSVFETHFPGWRIDSIELMMPFAYLLSGGVSTRSSPPGWMYPPWRGFERLLQPVIGFLAMFALITLRKAGG